MHLSERRNDGLRPFARMNGLQYTFAELQAVMKRNRIEKGLLLSPPLTDTGIVPNGEIVKLCRRSGKMLAPVITVEPTAKEVNAALTLAEKIEGELKAFKIRLGYIKASADSHVFAPLYDYAESEGFPVLFHTGDTAFSNGELSLSHPLNLDRVANTREELKMVLCHFGNPWFDDVAELIYKHKNVYTDMAGLITGGHAYAEKYAEWLSKKISEAIYFAGGAEKVIFGTDYPVTKYSDALGLVKMLDVSELDKERILWRNAERVYRL